MGDRLGTLESGIIFLAAAVVAVPIFKKLKLGAILGYLVAGVIIGPSVMHWINDPQTILHFAELGVVLLLFIIGLELEPNKIWRMRNLILVTGGTQLLVSATVISLIIHYFLDYSLVISFVIGLAAALSSTAFAVQLMQEHRILKSPPGQQGFAILLMQDIAVIPILLFVESQSDIVDQVSPNWWLSVVAILSLLVAGRYLIDPLLRLISRDGSSEVMTATALLLVVATAVGMEKTGLSMGMGAFVAGIMLANSSFKHQLETEIAPFKGLLLGLFFIAIGMNLNLQLLILEPLFIVGAGAILVLIKVCIIFVILKLGKQSKTDAIRIGIMLSQGGEFAFVVMAQAASNGLLDPQISAQITLIVGISMTMTAPLIIIHSLWFNSINCPAVYDSSADLDEPQVIIAGFGRFGQISGRLLAANKIPFTALDKDADHIQFLMQFGNKIFYGDACRLDLLKAAGIEHARIMLIAIDDEEQAIKLAKLVRAEYPSIKIIARGRNRQSVRKYTEIGVHHCVRELFSTSLLAGQHLLEEYGFTEDKAKNLVHIFAEHDRNRLDTSRVQQLDIAEQIELSRASRAELESLFKQDNR